MSAPYPQSSPPKPMVLAQQQYQQASPPISPPERPSPGKNQPLSQRPMTTKAQSQGPVAAPVPSSQQPQQPQQQSQSQSQSQSQAQKSTVQPPVSPTFASREKNRVSTLLEINRLLLQEVVDLQAQGKVVVPNQSPNQQSPTPTPPPGQTQGQEGDTSKPKHSPEFIEYVSPFRPIFRICETALGYSSQNVLAPKPVLTVAGACAGSSRTSPTSPASQTAPTNPLRPSQMPLP